MQDNLINQITLDYLMNKDQYDKYVSQTKKSKSNKRDKKFYKKRIYNLTKELLLGINDNVYSEVRYSFENYINSCIHYFKSLDNNDIIQENLNIIKPICSNSESDEFNFDLNAANEQYIKSLKSKENILTNLVSRETIGEKKKIILPQNRHINLKNPDLKLKGVKKFIKKKNINNIYEEICQNKEICQNDKTIFKTTKKKQLVNEQQEKDEKGHI